MFQTRKHESLHWIDTVNKKIEVDSAELSAKQELRYADFSIIVITIIMFVIIIIITIITIINYYLLFFVLKSGKGGIGKRKGGGHKAKELNLFVWSFQQACQGERSIRR